MTAVKRPVFSARLPCPPLYEQGVHGGACSMVLWFTSPAACEDWLEQRPVHCLCVHGKYLEIISVLLCVAGLRPQWVLGSQQAVLANTGIDQ
jgi:hypothetical protein